MILITTSRKPGRRTRSFCKELSRAIPRSLYVNRGKASIEDIWRHARNEGFYRILVVGETKGNPSIIRVLEGGRWVGQMYITGVSLCRERGCGSHEGDYVEVEYESDSFLTRVFAFEGEGDPVIVEERNHLVRFLFEGREVGPRMEVRGWEDVPPKVPRPT